MPTISRAQLVSAAEHRVLYESLWHRGAAHHGQQVIAPDAFTGRSSVLWALLTWHDTHRAPWPGDEPGDEPYSGVQRVLAVWNTARTLPADATGEDPMLSRALYVAVTTHALVGASLAPDAGWLIGFDTAIEVLNHSAGFHAAVYHATALDSIVSDLTTHHAQGDAA